LERRSNDVSAAKARWRIQQDRTAENGKRIRDLLNIRGRSDVLITVISTRRDTVDGYDPRYLSQTMTRTLDIMMEFHLDSGDPKFFSLALCNIDPQPNSYSELNKISEVYGIQSFARFNNSNPSDAEKKTRALKERNDYIYCLRKSLALQPRYVMLLEDDALPNPDALWVIKHIIRNYVEPLYKRYHSDELGFVKFYHPYRFFPRAVYLELSGLSALLGTVITLVHHWMAKDKSAIHFNWLFYSLLIFLIGVALGHANLLKMRHLSTYLYTIVPSHDCCTPAVLFTNSSGHIFADYFDKHTCEAGRSCAKDLVLRPFLNDTGTRGLMVMPNIFDHIGLYSAVTNRIKHPSVLH
jgi:hypothetical protein